MANKDFKVKNGIDVQTPIPVSMGGTGQTSTTNTLNALLPLQTSSSGYYLKTDGSNASWAIVSSSFVAMPSNSVSSNITLSSFNKYFVDTSAARTLNLPASPSVGDEIYVFDASGTASTYNITIARNGNLINSNAGNLILNINGVAASLVYTGATYGWKVG
jgi:hypothetical protein